MVKARFFQFQRTDRMKLRGLYVDVIQIESFTPGETADTTILGMRSGQSWEVHGGIAEVMDQYFDILRSISEET